MSLENLKKLIGEDIFNQYIAPKIEGKDYFLRKEKILYQNRDLMKLMKQIKS